MTGSDLREALDRAVRDEAAEVHVDGVRAWQDGQRRRVRQRVGAAVAAVAVLAVGGTAIAAITHHAAEPQPASPRSGASEHPLRLDYVYWDSDLPATSGPLAGLVERAGEDGSGWYAVSPAGRLWRVDTDSAVDVVPAVSPDGTHLGYMRGGVEDAVWVLADQDDGSEQTFSQIGTGVGAATQRYFQASQAPSFWSPDGSALLVRIGANRPRITAEPAAAVLGTDGGFEVIPTPRRADDGVTPVGWVDDDRVALVGVDSTTRDLNLWVVDAHTGRAMHRFELPTFTAEYNRTYQWFGSISPGADRLATAADVDGEIRYFALGAFSGPHIRSSPAVPHAADTCPASWTSTDLYVPTVTDRASGDSAVLVRADGTETILADPRLDVRCSVWARTALEGPEHRTIGSRLFGHNTSWLSWHWREVFVSTLSGVLLLGGAALLVLRRRRSTPKG